MNALLHTKPEISVGANDSCPPFKLHCAQMAHTPERKATRAIETSIYRHIYTLLVIRFYANKIYPNTTKHVLLNCQSVYRQLSEKLHIPFKSYRKHFVVS